MRFSVIEPISNKEFGSGRAAGDTRTGRNREASMNLTTAEIVFAASIAIAALTDTASAQTSQGSAVIDSSLRNAVERKDGGCPALC